MSLIVPTLRNVNSHIQVCGRIHLYVFLNMFLGIKKVKKYPTQSIGMRFLRTLVGIVYYL